ncbi:hypothetical protein cypCar_00022953 [Cyprinus carpio]|nr:hypothetical protein cypCar_00022953 [Cyprinus carpio]
MGEISEASLLEYICSSGGKVKNSDLSNTYKHFINHSDLQLRAKYREEFKLIIDRIAVVKSENQADSTLSPLAAEEKPEELSASDREDELDKDSGSKTSARAQNTSSTSAAICRQNLAQSLLAFPFRKRRSEGMGEDVHSFRSGPQSSAYLGDIVWDCIEQDVDTMSHGMLTLDRSSVYHAHFLLRLMQKLRAQISQCK